MALPESILDIHVKHACMSSNVYHGEIFGWQGEKECAYYMRTGNCKYGVTCKFNHPVVQQMGVERGLPLHRPMLVQNPASGPRSIAPPSGLLRSISTPHIAYRQAGLSSLQAWPPPYSLMQPPSFNAGPSSFIISSPQGAWNPYQASYNYIPLVYNPCLMQR